MRENRPYGSVGGWGLIAPRLPNQSKQPFARSPPSPPSPLLPSAGEGATFVLCTHGMQMVLT
jgi:hypothetical protein